MSTTIRITPKRLGGTVTPPPSKSQAHRALIAAALAGGESRVTNLAQSQDIVATQGCLAALKGAPARAGHDGLPVLDCGESGSTLRFLIPVALALRGGGRFTGRGRLMERPQQPYFDIFQEKSIFWEQLGGVLTVRGELTPGVYRLPGNISSQFITGLLYALPLLPGDSEILLTTPLESGGYVDMTLEVLEKFGIRVDSGNPRRFRVPGGQRYRPCDMAIEADWSQAAFWYAAKALGNPVEAEGLNPRSTQGDRVIQDHFVRLCRAGDVEIDLSGCPDLAPPLAAMAAVRDGTTRMVNAARLRIKESDRLAAITAVLSALGARVEEGQDSLTIHGLAGLAGDAVIDCCNDHRIAMMAAVAATRCAAPVTLLGAQCVNKSYPEFWEHYRMLGGELDVLISG